MTMRRMLRTIGSQRCKDELVCAMTSETLESPDRRQAQEEGFELRSALLIETGIPSGQRELDRHIPCIGSTGSSRIQAMPLPATSDREARENPSERAIFKL